MRANFLLFLLLSTCCLCGCSSRRNTPLHRSWYALNSRYNIYYNAQQAFTEGVKQIEKHGDTLQANLYFEESIRKCRKAIEHYSIREKPHKKRGWQQNPRQRALQNQTEYNPFIIHCWLLIGKTLYYQQNYKESLHIFTYIHTHFPEHRLTHTEVRLWETKAIQKRNLHYTAQPAYPSKDSVGSFTNKLTSSTFSFPSPEDSLFHHTIIAYQKKDFTTVRTNSTLFCQTYQQHPLCPPLLYIEALTYAKDGDREKMTHTLHKITTLPSDGTNIREIASLTLVQLQNGKKLTGEYIPLPSFISYSTPSALPKVPTFRTQDKAPAAETFYLMIVSPSATIPDNELLFQISSFNFTHLLQIQADTEIHWINTSRIVLIRGFQNIGEINLYLQKIKPHATLFGLAPNTQLIPISATNYSLLDTEKDLTDYLEFYRNEEGF